MRLSGQMEDVSNAVMLDYAGYRGFIAQIGILEHIFGVSRDALKIDRVSGVGQTIEINQPLDLRPIYDVVDQVRPNKSGSACDK